MDILSTEVVTGLIILGAFALSVRSIMSFSNQVTELRPKLSEIDRRLIRIRDGMDARQLRVEKLNDLIRPLKEKELHFRSYYEEIKRLELEIEREKLVAQQDEEDKKELNIQRKKMEGI